MKTIWRRRELMEMMWKLKQIMNCPKRHHYELPVIRFVVTRTSPVFKFRSQRKHRARLGEMAKKSGWYDLFERSAVWYATNKSFQTYAAVISIWMTSREKKTRFIVLSRITMENKLRRTMKS